MGAAKEAGQRGERHAQFPHTVPWIACCQGEGHGRMPRCSCTCEHSSNDGLRGCQRHCAYGFHGTQTGTARLELGSEAALHAQQLHRPTFAQNKDLQTLFVSTGVAMMGEALKKVPEYGPWCRRWAGTLMIRSVNDVKCSFDLKGERHLCLPPPVLLARLKRIECGAHKFSSTREMFSSIYVTCARSDALRNLTQVRPRPVSAVMLSSGAALSGAGFAAITAALALRQRHRVKTFPEPPGASEALAAAVRSVLDSAHGSSLHLCSGSACGPHRAHGRRGRGGAGGRCHATTYFAC